VAQDWETFSSAEGVALHRPGPDVMPYIMPIEVDPPRHRAYRMTVNPQLTPGRVSVYEDAIRGIANELIDPFVGRGSCDIAKEFARLFPGTVFFRLVVHCPDAQFHEVEPWARVISFESDNPERFAEAARHLREWSGSVIEARAGEPPTDDVVDAVSHLRDTGYPFADDELWSGLQILAQGGIGTSASAIGATVVILSAHTDLQERVRKDLALIPALMEEVLRLEPPVPLMFRKATRDVEVAGQQIPKGDMVGIFFGLANRDPAVFEDPDEVDIDRAHNRHLAFGGGVHRCIGSNLARLQIRIALEQLIERLSPFRIPDGAPVEYVSLQARGPMSIPLEFSPAS
jgi:cytochrome P450